jgi:hypothetical protein
MEMSSGNLEVFGGEGNARPTDVDAFGLVGRLFVTLQGRAKCAFQIVQCGAGGHGSGGFGEERPQGFADQFGAIRVLPLHGKIERGYDFVWNPCGDKSRSGLLNGSASLAAARWFSHGVGCLERCLSEFKPVDNKKIGPMIKKV